MRDGDLVRVKTGKYAGLIGELVGEGGTWGISIKPPGTSNIVSVPYPSGIRTVEELLESASPGPAIQKLLGRYDLSSL